MTLSVFLQCLSAALLVASVLLATGKILGKLGEIERQSTDTRAEIAALKTEIKAIGDLRTNDQLHAQALADLRRNLEERCERAERRMDRAEARLDGGTPPFGSPRHS